MWITLLIPRIEDGNNFGVSIQEETLGEVCYKSRAIDNMTALFKLLRTFCMVVKDKKIAVAEVQFKIFL